MSSPAVMFELYTPVILDSKWHAMVIGYTPTKVIVLMQWLCQEDHDLVKVVTPERLALNL